MKKLPLLLFVFAILMLLAFAWRSPFGARSNASPLTAGHQRTARQARTGVDNATLAARDASHRLVQVTIRNASDREAAQELGTIAHLSAAVKASRETGPGERFRPTDNVMLHADYAAQAASG